VGDDVSTLDELLRGGAPTDQTGGLTAREKIGRGLAMAMAAGNGSIGQLLGADEQFRRIDSERMAVLSSLPFKSTLAQMIDAGVPAEQAFQQTLKLFPMAAGGYAPGYRTVQPQALPDGLEGPPQAQRLPVLPPSSGAEMIDATNIQTKLDAYGEPGAYGAAARMAGAKVPISGEVAQALQEQTLRRLRQSDSFAQYETGVEVDGRGNTLLKTKERTQPLFPEGFTQQVEGYERFREVPTVFPGVVTIEPDPGVEASTKAAGRVLGEERGQRSTVDGGALDPAAKGKTPKQLKAEDADKERRAKVAADVQEGDAFIQTIIGQLEAVATPEALPMKGSREGVGVLEDLLYQGAQKAKGLVPNAYPDRAALYQVREATLGQIQKRFGGEGGVLTNEDIGRARGNIPGPEDSQYTRDQKLARMRGHMAELNARRLAGPASAKPATSVDDELNAAFLR
jgi:hypothetical protein